MKDYQHIQICPNRATQKLPEKSTKTNICTDSTVPKYFGHSSRHPMMTTIERHGDFVCDCYCSENHIQNRKHAGFVHND